MKSLLSNQIHNIQLTMNLDNRYSVSASLFMLNEIKNRHQNVRKAYQLLRRKADALRIKARQVALDLFATQAILSHTMREAYIALAAVKFTNGESNAVILENIGKAQVRVNRTHENIVGVPTVALRAVELLYVGDVLKYSGLGSGGYRTDEAKKAFRKAIEIVLKFASLRNTCKMLSDALQSTQRKVNGIEKVIMPKLLNTEIYIAKELDEREREEFYRLKIVKAKKKIIKLSELRNQQRGSLDPLSCETSRKSSRQSDLSSYSTWESSSFDSTYSENSEESS